MAGRAMCRLADLAMLLDMNMNSESTSNRPINPNVYVVAFAALVVVAVSNGIGVVKDVKDGEWLDMALSFTVMAVYAAVARYVYDAYTTVRG